MFKLVVASLLVAYTVASPVSPVGKNSDVDAVIVRSESNMEPDKYSYGFETDNGIKAEEHGEIHEVGKDEVVKSVQGTFSWVAPEGENIVIHYVADAEGYQPQGDAIPTPPPVPVQIARALEYIAAHPQPVEKTH